MQTFVKVTAISLLAAAAGALGGFVAHGLAHDRGAAMLIAPTQIDELTVQRLNVVEDDGSLALVIGNSTKLPGGGSARAGISGLIFFHRGDEVGGLIASRETSADGVTSGYVHLSFDQVKSNQTVTLNTSSEGDFVRTGLRIIDRATNVDYNTVASTDTTIVRYQTELEAAANEQERQAILGPYLAYLGEIGFFAERIYLGSEGELARTAKLELKDSRSRPRIRLAVDSSDAPRIEILDAEGEVVRSWSE